MCACAPCVCATKLSASELQKATKQLKLTFGPIFWQMTSFSAAKFENKLRVGLPKISGAQPRKRFLVGVQSELGAALARCTKSGECAGPAPPLPLLPDSCGNAAHHEDENDDNDDGDDMMIILIIMVVIFVRRG